MLCAFPISLDPPGKKVPCGQCMPCRINARRKWTGRILLEAAMYPGRSTFVTLTYDEDHVPKALSGLGEPVDTLDSRHLQLFIKRLRKHSSIRYFTVGEYGDRTLRPHYHGVLFGEDPGQLDALIGKTWHQGYHTVAELTPARAAYTVGYTVKKMNQTQELDGRMQEFARMSLRPPIGTPAIETLAEGWMTKAGARYIQENEDIPKSFRYAGKVYPLDRTMIRYGRTYMGISVEGPRKPWQAEDPLVTEERERLRRHAEAVHDKIRSRGTATRGATL